MVIDKFCEPLKIVVVGNPPVITSILLFVTHDMIALIPETGTQV